jgi:geranylgeranyl diphosphate synthase type I
LLTTGLGALVADVPQNRQEAYRAFGRDLGLAFQVQDDLLGIWGNAALTGKSTESDLVSGKKSLPVLYGLSQGRAFANRWGEGQILPVEVAAMAALLEAEGAREYAEQAANQLTARALAALEAAEPRGEAGEALSELANQLLKRKA